VETFKIKESQQPVTTINVCYCIFILQNILAVVFAGNRYTVAYLCVSG